MRSPRLGLLLMVLLHAGGPAAASAQSGAFVEWGSELSRVNVDARATTWHVTRIAGGVQREGQFGWMLSAERHRRGEVADWAAQAGGFRRADAWTLSGAAAFAARPDFLYRQSLEGELARTLGGGLVVHGGYRFLRFRDADVHIVQPALSWYVGAHEVQARAFLVRNVTTDQQATTVLVRAGIEASPRVRLAAGAAFGSRIFDVTAARQTAAEGWVAFASARVRLTGPVSLVIGGGGAEEEPLFTQRTLSVGARWDF